MARVNSQLYLLISYTYFVKKYFPDIPGQDVWMPRKDSSLRRNQNLEISEYPVGESTHVLQNANIMI